ncbi:MAG TPA: hypothetical protein VGI97_12000 [Gemmatimonadaceae bacterium]
MYSACIFCNKPLGANETFETFPVGKRLAFDAAKGRLWVVCSTCERWNLSPLEERWEAIELAERLYRDARRRVSTDNVGLARLRDGTTLVRIGDPLRPEFAAWRYGDQFGRRRNRQLLIAGAGIVAVSAVVVGGIAAGASAGMFGGWYGGLGNAIVRGRPNTIVAKIPTADGVVAVRRRHLAETSIASADDGRPVLELRHVMADSSREQKRIGPRYGNGRTRFEGRDAERVAAILVPKVNRFGGAKRDVGNAVEEIERVGSAEAYLERLAKLSTRYTEGAVVTRRRGFLRERADMKSGLFGLPKEHRLALEMALHEEAERRALDGELEELERAWRDAEEVAAISDDLLLPESVTAKIGSMR